MSKVNITNELIERHSTEEIIDYLSGVMRGVVQNYKVAIEKNQPELLFGNLGDLTQVTAILVALKKKQDERLAQINDQQYNKITLT